MFYGYTYIPRLRFLVSASVLNFRNFVIKLRPHNLVKFNIIIITFILLLCNRFAAFAFFYDTLYPIYRASFISAFIRKLLVFISLTYFSPYCHKSQVKCSYKQYVYSLHKKKVRGNTLAVLPRCLDIVIVLISCLHLEKFCVLQKKVKKVF